MAMVERSSSDFASAGGEDREPCPTPLAWHEVLEAFRNDSESWDFDHHGTTVSGRALGTGPPLYFLNGIGGTCDLYCLITWLLRDRFRCVLFEYPRPRGFGSLFSSRGDYVRLLSAVMNHQGHERVDLYATSFGSVTALGSMIDTPLQVRRVILQGGFAFRRISVFERMVMHLLRHLPVPLRRIPLGRAIQLHNHRTWFPPYDHSRWSFFERDTGQVPVSELARRARVLLRFDVRRQLGRITTPTLLVRTEGDGLVTSRCMDELENGLVTATTRSMHSCGHLPWLTHPHRLTKIIRDFLSESSLDSATLP